MVNPHSKFNASRVMAIPYGLSARSTFDDSFTLHRCETAFGCELTEENKIDIKREAIAWSNKEADAYKNIDVSEAYAKGLISKEYLD